MSVTEKFESEITTKLSAWLFSRTSTTSDEITREIIGFTLEHKGKRYALKIVELDAELPQPSENIMSYSGDYAEDYAYGLAQKDMSGWVKGVDDD